jgi:transcription elongation factor
VIIASGSHVAHSAAPAWAAECAARDDDAARLACYDSLNPPRKSAARAQGSAPPTAAAGTPAAAAATPTPAADSRAPAANATPPAANAHTSAASTPRAAAPPAAASNNFGLTEQRERESAKAKAAEATDLIAHVASVSAKLTGERLLKLDNGQSWVQAQRDSSVFIKAGERVTISRGTFGGYLLRSDSGVTMRVRRLE